MPDETDRYPVDPSDGTAQFKEKLKELERRIAELEAQRVLP